MKTNKEKGNGRWQRAIIGILMALIMVGSVIAMIVQMGSAGSGSIIGGE